MRPREPVEPRLRARLREEPGPLNTPCHVWTGCVVAGYGQISLNGYPAKAHRVAYELWVGPIPPGLFVCHRCDRKTCCNPEHLYAGDAHANMGDMVRRGRSLRGERNPKAILTAGQVAEIRRRHAAGETYHALAPEFGVKWQTIGSAVGGRNWKHV